MDKRRFGSTGQDVSVIGQGTWYIEQGHKPDAIAALRRGLDLGLNHIDTAELYGSGKSESIIAEAIDGRRDEVFLVTKVMPSNASRKGTIEACEKSLARLKTDRLDCYLLHWRGDHPLEDTIAALEALKEAGKILSWGVSNFDTDDLDDVLAIAGEGKLASNQVLYHLGERAIEHAVIPWCEKHQVAVVAYSPFGHNQFPGPTTPGGRVLAEIAQGHEAKPRQVALAFLARDPVVFPIPKAGSAAHIAENASLPTLSADDVARIDAAFPRGVRPRTLPTL